MSVTVLLFAGLREIVGAGELSRPIEAAATVDAVWRDLRDHWPALTPYGPSLTCAVNAQYAPMSSPVQDGDEVAFLPPVSGG